MSNQTVLVTGVGAIIGYGIVHALRQLTDPPRIIGTDIYPDAVGQVWCDDFVRAVPAASEEYLEFVAETVRSYGIDLVIPGIEQDIHRLSRGRDCFSGCPARVALNSAALIETATDKWETHQTLVKAGYPVIKTRIDGDFDELKDDLGLPFLMKLRTSYASKGMQWIDTEYDLEYWKNKVKVQFMVQEIVGNADEEFTVGVFGYGDGTSCRPISFRRKLSGEGATAKAWLENHPVLDKTVESLVALFKPVGPTNFQFRRHKGEFLLLEVNPRISSSTSLRAAFGFNEPAMCLDFYLSGKLPVVGELRTGCAFRYIEDIVYFDRDSF